MPKQEKKYYTIDFVYTDNSQQFATGAFLDDEEKATIEEILEKYHEAGAIMDPNVYQPIQANQNFDAALNEVMEALESEITDGDDTSECQNCSRIWPDSFLNVVKDLYQRVAPGEPMPSGECPACGAVCHPTETTD